MDHKTLSEIDVSNTKALREYEDLLRKRLKRIGFNLKKRKTIQTESHSKSNDKGFKIIDTASETVIYGANYDLSISEVESFWRKEFEKRDAEKQERDFKKRLKKLNAIQLDGGRIVTNDARALQALKDHITQYGDFNADGHGAGGDIASVMYRAYRPFCCPKFSRVWPADGDWQNLTDLNLKSDADEATLPAGLVPITTQRRIWHDEHRIFIKLSAHNQVFFTEWDRNLFEILSNRKLLNDWYIQLQERKSKTVYRLSCRTEGKTIVSFAEIVALYDEGKIDLNNVADSLLAGKRWLRDNELQVDHLRDNTANNCRHNLVIMPKKENGGKSDVVTELYLPYAFIPVRMGENIRVLCGKFAGEGQYSSFISCNGWKQLLECLDWFKRTAKASGEMFQRTDDTNRTNCISQMLYDDGQEYHDGQYNAIEGLLRAEKSTFTPWDKDLPSLKLNRK